MIFKPNISRLKERRDVTGLLDALTSKDTHTRREAIQALGEIGAKAAVPFLVEILADVHNREDKEEAGAALRKIGDREAIEALVKANMLSRERERTLIDAAVASPNRRYREGFYVNRISSNEGFVLLLCDELKHKSDEVRQWAAHCLGEFSKAQAVTK